MEHEPHIVKLWAHHPYRKTLYNSLTGIFYILKYCLHIVSGNAYFAHFFLVSQNPKTLKQAMSAYSQARVPAKFDL
jgi:hypothetical protein